MWEGREDKGKCERGGRKIGKGGEMENVRGRKIRAALLSFAPETSSVGGRASCTYRSNGYIKHYINTIKLAVKTKAKKEKKIAF